MKVFWWIAFLILIAIAIFAVQNSNAPPVIIKFLIWKFETSLVYTILGSIALGILLVLFFWIQKSIGASILKQVKEVPRDQWAEKTVREVMMPIREEIMLGPDGEAVDALQKMIRTGEGCLPVVKDGRGVGMLTRRDILNLLEIKTDLAE
jgi:uncharacterized integral membrane protein